MKRIHLFEWEDLRWFPPLFRQYLTRLILVMHDLLDTHEKVAHLLSDLIKQTRSTQIVDLCSGSGGPMPKVFSMLRNTYDFSDLRLILTDLYPDLAAAKSLNDCSEPNITYSTQAVDATQLEGELKGIRTMIAGFHHMPPKKAKQILVSAIKDRAPILIFEISDNSAPIWLWWLTLPINILTALLITPMVRPIDWKQIVLTYLIPVIPLCFAWDGAVSNARTYTLSDLDELLADIPPQNFVWEKGTIRGKAGTKQLYLMGYPR